MIESQIKEYVSLASQYGIGDIVIAEMGRLNRDQEVRLALSSFPFFFFCCDRFGLRSVCVCVCVCVLRMEFVLKVARFLSASSSPGSRIPS